MPKNPVARIALIILICAGVGLLSGGIIGALIGAGVGGLVTVLTGRKRD